MSIDWSTLALQAINVLILLWLLHRFLYRPVLAVIERRQAEIERNLQAAEASRSQAEASRTASEAERAALAAQRQQSLGQIEAEAEAVRRERLGAAEVQVARLLDDGQARLAQERRDAEAQLQRTAAGLAVDFARRILARVPSSALLHAYLEDLATQAGTLRAAPSLPLRVVSAAPLSEADCGYIVERLSPLLDAPLQWSFDVDAALLGGLEVHRGDTVISHTLMQDLTRLEAAVNSHGNAL